MDNVSLDSSSDIDTVHVMAPPRADLETGAHAQADVPHPQGHLLGRYVIVEQAGLGGMGRVYRAYDPKLRREVALKSLRPSNGDGGMARMVREAQAMARLSHPNVVPIYDVEEVDGAVFITMEYVAGETLQRWLESPRPWHDIVEVFRDAGRGLAAAHAAGLVHRDFKPSNVMVGIDGRARVMDFGLARAEGEPEHDAEISTAHSGMSGFSAAASQPLTQAGLVMGTPPYMAPEAHGGEYDGRGDQFSLCVALFEALYRRRPFAATPGRTLLQAKLEGAIDMPEGPDVPAWLHRAVVRGLAARPEDRHPDMDALLAALVHDDPRRRRRWVAGAVAVSVVGLATVVTFRATAARAELCTGAAARLATAWDPSTREAVTQAFAAVDKPYAVDASERVVESLDAYADRWSASYAEACQATQVRGEQSTSLMDARIRCLEGRLDQLRAVGQTLEDADAGVVDRASTVVSRLPSIDRCDDAAYVTAQVAPPEDPAIAAEVEVQRRELARAKALADAGRYREAMSVAKGVEAAAHALDDLPLRVATQARIGHLHDDLDEFEPAVAALETAFHGARRARLDEVRIDAAIGLVHVLGTRLERSEPALLWAGHAASEIDLAGDDDDRARLAGALGGAHFHRGDVDAALAAYEQARSFAARVNGERSPQVAGALKNLGGIYGATGRWIEAQAVLERAVELGEAIYGPEHPANVAAIENLGNVYNRLGRGDEALALHQRSLRIQENAIGVDATGVGETCVNLAYDYLERLDYAEARRYFERALAIFESQLGSDHAKTGHAHSTLALALLYGGDVDAALAHAERGAVILESAHGSDHPAFAAALGRVAEVQLGAGRYREAEASSRRSMEIWSSKHGADNPELSFVLHRLGRALIGQGRPREAVVELERALEIHVGEDAAFLAEARAALAAALWDAGGDRARAASLARESRDALLRLGDPARGALERIDGWLAQHDA